MESGLAATQTERNLIVACDMPFISVELGQYLLSCLGNRSSSCEEHFWLTSSFAAYRKDVNEAVTASARRESTAY